jgi:plasmid stabilization system protein ParE
LLHHIIAEAQADVDGARRYLNSQTLGLGEQFLEDLDRVIDRIRKQPSSFPVLETLDDDLPIRRALLTRFSYIVAFEIQDDQIIVLCVVHQRRSLEPWIHRRR